MFEGLPCPSKAPERLSARAPQQFFLKLRVTGFGFKGFETVDKGGRERQ